MFYASPKLYMFMRNIVMKISKQTQKKNIWFISAIR